MDKQWLQRRMRIRAWLKPLPRRANIRRYPIIKSFSRFTLKRPYLWSFKNAPVLRALYLGSLLAYMPSYGLQILIALAVAWFARANLTLMVGLQMITNPLTAGPIYLSTYFLGDWLAHFLHLPERSPALDGALALILGGLVLGLITAVVLHGLWLFGQYEAQQFRSRRQRAKNARILP